jgi:hypothetical protein
MIRWRNNWFGKMARTACSICLSSLASITFATDKEIELEGSDASALCYALKAFTRDYPKTDLKNFSVYIEVPDDRKLAQIAFVPLPEPVNLKTLVLRLGGSNKFGEEVHYVLSRKPLKIVRKFYGR